MLREEYANLSSSEPSAPWLCQGAPNCLQSLTKIHDPWSKSSRLDHSTCWIWRYDSTKMKTVLAENRTLKLRLQGEVIVRENWAPPWPYFNAHQKAKRRLASCVEAAWLARTCGNLEVGKGSSWDQIIRSLRCMSGRNAQSSSHQYSTYFCHLEILVQKFSWPSWTAITRLCTSQPNPAKSQDLHARWAHLIPPWCRM